MDLLEFQSLIGIWVIVAEKKLTPISTDVFVSIPDRDLGPPGWVSLCPPINSITSCLSFDLFDC